MKFEVHGHFRFPFLDSNDNIYHIEMPFIVYVDAKNKEKAEEIAADLVPMAKDDIPALDIDFAKKAENQ